jgi:hypothetical protein
VGLLVVAGGSRRGSPGGSRRGSPGFGSVLHAVEIM